MDNREVMMAGHFEIHLDGSVTIVIGNGRMYFDVHTTMAEEFVNLADEVCNPPVDNN